MTPVSAADLLALVVLALPVAAISWTVTHEELFREFHDYCVERSRDGQSLASRKFFYLLTCEYCFSHYVAAAALVMSGFTLLFDDWRGHLIAWFSLVWVANHLISAYGRLRLGIKSERLDINLKEAVTQQAVADTHEEAPPKRRAG